jgi:glucosamine-6-phosphate deaminase
MKIIVRNDPVDLGKEAGREAGQIIRAALKNRGFANIILATGTSQFESLNQLTREKVDWKRVTMFHLDEYIGLPESSPASFRKYLKERFIQKTGGLQQVHLINGEKNPAEECLRLNEIIGNTRIDLALLGIGENGHLGFNDPPADFETEKAFIMVALDEKCRRQQIGEGWFQRIDDVPRQAITMSVKQIMKSAQIICSVPDSRKAQAVKDCFENPVSNLFPGSILQEHPQCICFLDKLSSALLEKNLHDLNNQ